METRDFKGICKLAESGKIKWVDNMKTHQPGRVVSCTEQEFEVEFQGRHENWSPEDCKERTYGYRMRY